MSIHRRLATTVAVLMSVFVAAPVASGATITVTNTNDSGVGSLRQAISDASGADTISIPSGVYRLNSVLTVSRSLTFTGAGAATTFLDGQSVTPVMTIQSPAAVVSISGITVRNGENPTGDGGGILSNVPLTLTDDAIVGNSSGHNGGGLAISSVLMMKRDLVAGNSAPAGAGGGIELEPSSASTSTISDTTVTQNSADGFGAGVNEDDTSTETVQLFNDSLVFNTVTGTAGEGGGFRAWSGTTMEFRNSLFAQNSSADQANCAHGSGAHVTSLGHNAQDTDDPGCFFTAGDLVNVAPQLGPLADNGGPTSTLLPAGGSPLINAGDPANCATTDQRGVPRPQNGGCDIGAVERTTPTVATPVAAGITTAGAILGATVNPVDIGGSFSYRYGLTAAYGSATPATPLMAGVGSQPAVASLTGLASGTAYHSQLVISTPDGSASSGDVTFTTAKRAVAAKAPAISNARLSHRRFRVGRGATAVSARRHSAHKPKSPQGTTFVFTLSGPAKLELVITHNAPGLRRGRKCVAATGGLRRKHAKRCTRTLIAGSLTRSHEAPGTDRLAFSGRVGRRALAPGAYEATITASNAGGRSKAKTLAFTIVK
jgi:hypothetical protein